MYVVAVRISGGDLVRNSPELIDILNEPSGADEEESGMKLSPTHALINSMSNLFCSLLVPYVPGKLTLVKVSHCKSGVARILMLLE